MNLDIKYIYFVGIGGIGMSALARYFLAQGKKVAGYDRRSSLVTDGLEKLGAEITFSDKTGEIPEKFKNKQETLVVYTPAIKNSPILSFFQAGAYEIYKRSAILGTIFNQASGIAVAGTHGKTTTTAILAHIFKISSSSSAAFVGGIMKNYDSNFISDNKPEFIIAEADEFDRSFLQLNPQTAVITSVDADHLDIYGTKENLIKTFEEFITKIDTDGNLLISKVLNLKNNTIKQFTYGIHSDAQYQAFDIKATTRGYRFSLKMPDNQIWENLHLSISGIINVKNAVAAVAVAALNGVSEAEIRDALNTFKGIKRRFDIWLDGKVTFIDDYAHHPEEIAALLRGLRDKYPKRKITAIFQPHLFTRTRDFIDDFAHVLGQFDEIVLLPIYPAREEPIEGINSMELWKKIDIPHKNLVPKADLIKFIKENIKPDVVVTIGAGDIDTELEKIYQHLKEKNN